MIRSDRFVWSYSLYGSNYDSYYKPLLENISLSRISNAVVVLNVLDSDVERVKDYFRDYLDFIYIFAYESLRYGNNPKMLRFLVSNQIESNFYFYKDSDSVVNKKKFI